MSDGGLEDLVVAGGGPAGLAVAIEAARRGLSVVVLERASPPADKACGEGILPAGVAWLERAGLAPERLGGAPLEGVRHRAGAHVAEARFPGRPGLGVRRTTLVAALRERARSLGVRLEDGVTVRAFEATEDGVAVDTDAGRFEGRWLAGADGLSSRVRAGVGLERDVRSVRRRFGIRRHFRAPPFDDLVEVHWGEASEAYVTPLGGGVVGVAILFEGRGTFDALLPRFPNLARRLAGAERLGRDLGAGPFPRAAAARGRGRVLLVGDAAGSLDPISGEGLTVAFRQATELAEVLAGGGCARRYDRRARRVARDVERLTRLLLRLSTRADRREDLVALLARRPALLERSLAILAGERSFASLLGPAALRLLPLLGGQRRGTSVQVSSP